MIRSFREVWLAALAVVAIAGFIAFLGADGYPGVINDCVDRAECYCETIRGGRVAQPANSWSNLGFVAVGFAVLADIGRRRRRDPMDPWIRYGALYGGVAIFLGVGSWLFHGTMRAWGGAFDLLSMYAFIAFAVAFPVARIRNAGSMPFHAVFWPILVATGLSAFLIPQRFGKFVFGGLIVVALFAEAAVTTPALRPGNPGDRRADRVPWFWAGLVTFVVAWIIWNLSGTGAVLCRPDSLLQGHAAWHLLTAGSVTCFAVYWSRHAPGVTSPISTSGVPRNG